MVHEVGHDDARLSRGGIPHASLWLFRLFARYSERYLRRHFHALRLSLPGGPPRVGDEPLLVYLNHPSWWDPLVGLILAYRLFPDRRHFAPIESAALARYRFLERLGFFAIEPRSRRGALRFLEVATAVLDEPRSTLWVTPQGAFADVRQRPAGLRPGIAHLARRMTRGLVLPVALEYPFWQERTPEALVRLGSPVDVQAHGNLSARQWLSLLEQRLTETQDLLAQQTCARSPIGFDTLLSGRAGVGGPYDWWRRARAAMRGQRFTVEHAS